jgi:hypothetical protein
MQSIGSIIPKNIQRAGIDNKVVSSQAVSIFEKIKDDFLDSDLSRKVQAMYFKENTLNIASLSTKASQDLTVKTGEIIDRLNTLIGHEVVKEIKVIV